MKKRSLWKRAAVWGLTMALLLGDGSLAVFAEGLEGWLIEDGMVSESVSEGEQLTEELSGQAETPEETAEELPDEAVPGQPEALKELDGEVLTDEASGEQSDGMIVAQPDEQPAEDMDPADGEEPPVDELLQDSLFVDDDGMPNEEETEGALVSETEEGMLKDSLLAAEESDDYSVWFDDLRGGDWSWMYTDEAYPLSLNTENLQGLKEGAVTYKWQIGRWQEEGFVPSDSSDSYYEINGDGSSITLKGESLKAEYDPKTDSHFDVRVVVEINGVEVPGCGVGMDLREPVYEYHWPYSEPGERVLLPHDSKWFGRENCTDCYVEDQDHPFGENVPVELTNVEAVSHWTWNQELGDWEVLEGQAVVEAHAAEDGSGWSLDSGEVLGYSRIRLSYKDVKTGEDKTYGADEEAPFDVYVNGDLWNLDWLYPNDSQELLAGQSMAVGSALYHSWTDENFEWHEETVENYRLVLTGDGNCLDRVDLEVGENGTSVIVSAPAQEEGQKEDFGIRAEIRILIPGDDGEMEFRKNLYADVRSGEYYVLMPSELKGADGERLQVGLGEELDLASQDLRILRFDQENPEGQPVDDEDFHIRLDGWDENVWTRKEDTDELRPTLVRNGAHPEYPTDIRIVAEMRQRDENGDVCTDEGGNEIWGEIASRDYWFDELNTDVWFDDLRGGDWSWMYTDEAYPLSLNTENLQGLKEGAVTYEWQIGRWQEEVFVPSDSSDSYYEVNGDGSSITLNGALLKQEYDPENWEGYFDVRALVKINDALVSEPTLYMDLRDSRKEFRWPLREQGDRNILKGETRWIGSQDVTCDVENEDYPDGQELPVTIREIRAASHWQWDSELNGGEGDWAQVTDKEIVSVQADPNGQGWNLQAGPEDGFTRLEIIYTDPVTNEEATYGTEGEDTFDMYVMDQYDVIRPNELTTELGGNGWSYNVNVGEELDLDAFDLHIERFSTEEGESGRMTGENFRIRLISKDEDGWDPNVWSIKAGTEENPIPVLIRTPETEEGNPYSGTEIRLIAEERDQESGEWFETAQWSYWIGDVCSEEDHNWEEVSRTETACVTEGEIVYHCLNCDVMKYESISAIGHSWDEGKVTKAPTCVEAGIRTFTCQNGCGTTREEEIPATGHSWGAWTTSKKATALEAETQTRVCAVCGETESRIYGEKLPGTISLTATSLLMQTKQSTSAFKVTKMTDGDYVKSVKSNKSGIVKVSNVKNNGTFTLTAQKKTGTAKITVTLASGTQKSFKVTVKKAAVKTKKITGVKAKLSLEKGKTQNLKPVLAPVTSQDPVTYTTSNKKVATVSAKGKITAKGSGTATITVKSGGKTVKCKVTVTVKCQKLTGIKSKVTLKKGASMKLAPKKSPADSTDKITYASSDKSIVTVGSKGKITAKKKGTATVTVKCGTATAECRVTVK